MQVVVVWLEPWNKSSNRLTGTFCLWWLLVGCLFLTVVTPGCCERIVLKQVISCLQKRWQPSNPVLKVQFSSVQSLSHVRLFATPRTAACQASLSITNSWSLPKLMSIESVMPSNHLILCCPLLLLPTIFPSITVFFLMSWFFGSGGQSIGASASVLPMDIQGWFPLGLTALISLLSKGLSGVFSSTTIRKHHFFSPQPFYCSSLTSVHDYWKNHSFE